MDLKKLTADYIAAHHRHKEASAAHIKLNSSFATTSENLSPANTNYISSDTAQIIIDKGIKVKAADDELNYALAALESASTKLLTALSFVNYVPVVVYVGNDGYMITPEKKGGQYIITHMSYAG